MGTEWRGALSGAGGGGANMRLSRSRCSGAVMAMAGGQREEFSLL